MGRFDALAKALGLALEKYGDDAAKILEKVDSPELATSLKGAERGEYLKALDDVYGNQAKRASDMGFAPETYYHGTGRSIDKFDPKFHGSHTGPGLTKDRFWFTDNPETAEIFSSSSAKLDVSRKAYEKEDQLLRRQADVYNELKNSTPKEFNLNKLFNTPDSQLNVFKKYGDLTDDQINLIKEYNQIEETMRPIENQRRIEMKESTGNIIPVKLRLPAKLPVKDMDGKFWSESAREIPEGGIKLTNFRESTPLEEAPKATSIGLQNPSRVRSEFAAFDPRFKDSPLLMAGALAAPMGKQVVDMNPLHDIKAGFDVYDQGKEKLAKALASQINIGRNPKDEAYMTEAIKMGADPINFVPGAGGMGLGLIQAASSMIPNKKDPIKTALERSRSNP